MVRGHARWRQTTSFTWIQFYIPPATILNWDRRFVHLSLLMHILSNEILSPESIWDCCWAPIWFWTCLRKNNTTAIFKVFLPNCQGVGWVLKIYIMLLFCFGRKLQISIKTPIITVWIRGKHINCCCHCCWERIMLKFHACLLCIFNLLQGKKVRTDTTEKRKENRHQK